MDKLGYVYLPSEPVDISQLRTTAIGQAVAAGDQAYVIVDMCRERAWFNVGEVSLTHLGKCSRFTCPLEMNQKSLWTCSEQLL